VWKPPHQTKGKVLRKTLQVLARSGKSPHLEGGTHWNYTVVAGLQDDLVDQQSKSNRNIRQDSQNTTLACLRRALTISRPKTPVLEPVPEQTILSKFD
jgi:hypothetical protein